VSKRETVKLAKTLNLYMKMMTGDMDGHVMDMCPIEQQMGKGEWN
jgi:hypothetical protein